MEIIAILIGVIGVLAGALTGVNSKRKEYKKQSEELKSTIETQEKITDTVLNHNKQINERTDNFKSGAGGTIKKLAILLCFSFLLSACSYYKPTAPKLYIIDKPADFKDIEYKHINNNYCFDDAGIKELLRQLDWCSNAIKTYEQQIKIYNKFLKGIK